MSDQSHEFEESIKLASTRRNFLKGAATTAAVAGVGGLTGACGQPAEQGAEQDPRSITSNLNEEESGEYNVTSLDIAHSERVLGLNFTEEEREQIVEAIGDQIQAMESIRALDRPNELAPAQVFDPRLPGQPYPGQDQSGPVTIAETAPDTLPSSETAIAFAPLSHLARWVETRQISSRELTELYLRRIEQHGAQLECFVTVLADLARQQADAADAEIAAGNYRGPLHGIPYGVKDLMDTEGIRTTWGATPYADRVAQRNAAVVNKLADAGAVLIGKTTCGALAYGDIWFGGRTRNPWNPNEGSSGSSAGSASATAAGLVGFSIGTETLGSIVSPSHRCGATGLRPTFGSVSRYGAMALCWSLDKIGPICRGVEDTVLVFAAITGEDSRDAGSLSRGFAYDGNTDIRDLRVGYLPGAYENASETDRNALQAARDMGLNLVEVDLPQRPYGAMVPYLVAEAAAAFQHLTLENLDDSMVWQDVQAWPNSFRTTHFLSAVDLINMDRFRREVMQIMDGLWRDSQGLDALIAPNFANGLLVITNFTGSPQLAVKGGFIDTPTRTIFGNVSEENEAERTWRVPETTSVFGPLFGEGPVLAIGRALERELDVRGEHPPLFT